MTTRDSIKATAAILREVSQFVEYPLADNRKWIRYHLDEFESVAIANANSSSKYMSELMGNRSARLICLLACFFEFPDTATWSKLGELLNEYQHLYFSYSDEEEQANER
jgi:hypothetical protein